MKDSYWGLLGPEILPSQRRTRTLDIGASVRQFNDLAVPGLGGVWFGKQIMLSTLGIYVAELAREKGFKVQNIETANAIEALACWLTFDKNGWKGDSRTRGNVKLKSHAKLEDEFSFKRARQRNFYVTQPMRMATVQTLPALELVESSGVRFNSFAISEQGRAFVEAACEGSRPYNRDVINHLVSWVLGDEIRVTSSSVLTQVLSQTVPLTPSARHLLTQYLVQGNPRRQAAFKWLENWEPGKSKISDWSVTPKALEQDHWFDLFCGMLFFKVRENAIRVLDALECVLGNTTVEPQFLFSSQVPESVKKEINILAESAKSFIDQNHSDKLAKQFCQECTQPDDKEILKNLVKRDNQVLRLVGEKVLPGPAFQGKALENELDDEEEFFTDTKLGFPEGISHRVGNLFYLQKDLLGGLETFITKGELDE